MKLYDWLKVAPYQVDDQSAGDDDDDLSAAKGLRVLAVAYSTERSAFLGCQLLRHDMTYSVLKVPLNPNQPTSVTY